jgi:salicylate hydroxylase
LESEGAVTDRRKILIAGAGLGGLAAAAGLLRAGHDVQVFEQAPALGEVGAGIQLSANASRVLIDLGLKQAIEAVAVRPLRTEFRLHDTAEIVNVIPLGEAHETRFGTPYYHIYRPDLHNILVDAVSKASPDCIHLSAGVRGYAEDADGVTLTLADGRSFRGDLLIAGDGIKSVVRAQMHGDTPANFTGNVAWRVMVPRNRLPENFMDRIFINWMGPKKHMVVYWVRGGELLNFVGCVEKPEWRETGWAVRAPWQDLKDDYAGWHPDVQTMIDAADREACYCWALNNRPRLPYWSTGRVTLLGDAAHPTLPYMAQGAVMAIEDGAVLRRALEQADIPTALKLYEAARIDRTARIVDESTEHAKLYHHDTAQAFRDAFAAKDPAKDRGLWLYNYDPLTVPLG